MTGLGCFSTLDKNKSLKIEFHLILIDVVQNVVC